MTPPDAEKDELVARLDTLAIDLCNLVPPEIPVGNVTILEAARRIESDAATIAALREDAERYRVWRDFCLIDDWDGPLARRFDAIEEPVTAAKWDAAIDATRKERT